MQVVTYSFVELATANTRTLSFPDVGRDFPSGAVLEVGVDPGMNSFEYPGAQGIK